MTTEAKGIIRDTGTKITKKDALKLSRLEPEQQRDAASQLAAEEIKSMGEYHPAPAEEPQSRDRINFPGISIFQHNICIHIWCCEYRYYAENFCIQEDLSTFLCDSGFLPNNAYTYYSAKPHTSVFL